MSTPTPPPTPPPTTLILGAGVLGTSTAHHLSLTHPPHTVTILDRTPYPPPPGPPPNPGASSDLNKILRADYTSPFYMALATRALTHWTTSRLLSPYFHRSGWVQLSPRGSDQRARVRANFAAREARGEGLDESRDVGLREVKNGFAGLLAETDVGGFEGAYWNPGAGWAEADKALAAMLEGVVGRGVRYVRGEVEGLVLRPGGGGVEGVRVRGGEVISADRVVLATGAWTSEVMEGVEAELGIRGEGRVEGQAKAAGVCVAHFRLGGKEMERWEGAPVVVYGGEGEVIPPLSSGHLKFTNASTFTSTRATATGHLISIPPDSQTAVPARLKAETLALVKRIMPSMLSDNRTVDYWRLCWDSITPTQDQLITRHPDPRLANLYLAVGGSFHSWKFLPIIGEYMVNVLEGRGNGKEMDERWGWKKEGWGAGKGKKGAHEKVVPTRELADLEERMKL